MSAVSALDIQNLPTPKEERWKYTNLPRALPEGLRLVTDTPERVIHIPRGEVCAELEDILWTSENDQHLQPRLKIVLEENAELHLLERQEGQGAYWKNMVTEIEVADNAKLVHYRLQNDSAEAVNTNMVSVRVGRGALYEKFSINCGANLSRHQVHAELTGPGGTCTLNGINLFADTQHGDTTILIEHQAPNCQSNQDYRTILDDTARGVFQGKVHVHQIAQKTDGYQLSNALLLSEGAEMDTKPELEIYADDVRCSHGATTGRLDETPLFYMRARGIPEASARRLLLRSFLGEVVDKIEDESVHNLVDKQVDQWLSRM